MLKIPLNIQKFAVSASITGENYGGSSTTNKSYIKGTITISTSGQTHNFENSAYYQINGGEPHYFSIGYNSTVTFSYDSLGPYTHNPDGTLGNQTVSLYVRITSSTSTSTNVSVHMNTIPRFATMNSATNFNDEQNPSFTYSNPAGLNNLSCWLEINPNGEHLAERNITSSATSGTYTWELTNEEREQLRAKIPNSNTATCRIGLYSTLSGSTQASYKDMTFTIINGNPIFNNFEFEDINPTTLALTGDSSKNINGFSTIRATISTTNKAEAIKSATMNKYRFIIGTTSTDINYSDEESVSGNISNAINGTYNVYAIDSRNNSTLVTKLASQEIAYTPINFISSNCKVERNNGGVGEYAVLTINGEIWNDNFGQVSNSITSVLIEYKETSSSTWLTSPTTITPTISGNSFNFTGQVASQEQDYSFELNKSYDFRITIEDELSTKTIQLTPMSSSIPNMSFADNGVGIMCDYDENLGGLLQVGGKIIDGLERYLDVEHQIGYWLDNKPLYSIWHSKTISSGTLDTLLNINRNDYGVIWVNKAFSDSSNSKSVIGTYYYQSNDFQRVHIEQGNQVIWQRGSAYPRLPVTVYYELRYTKVSD